ncbi:hypothetical protein ABEB36_011181 [Hypothenemus hampei]|uniref:Serpin domain-containing protein n=1 Tax=Hypothenemus hampei TaxID=57062 RepID=A0ABD1EEQ5_HYPHA
MNFHTVLRTGILLSIISPAFLQEKFNIADSINKFSIDLLAAVNAEGGNDLNIALSPLTIWTSLTIVSEGAFDSTVEELERALGQPHNKNIVRDSYVRLNKLLQQSKSIKTEFETSTGIFSRSQYPVKEKFAKIVKEYYDVSITSVDFESNSAIAADVINKYVAAATKNRILNFVSSEDVRNAYLFLTSTLFFKGQWQTPFNKSATQRDTFFDDKKVPLGDVQMMYQAHPYAFNRIDKIKAQAVELPYGTNNDFSMIVMVPRGVNTVTDMLNALSKESMTEILANLEKNRQTFYEDDIHVYLPKFKITSDFNMERVLMRMGVKDVFNSQKANLLGMFPHYLYLSRIIQKAEIEVDEDGTVAAAAAGSTFVNRSPPPVLRANRPFAFFIVHKKSGSIIFAGKICNPNTLS